jgi:hypothetical protein
MAVGDDEDRAAAYRAEHGRREAYRVSLEAQLSGSPSAAAAVREHWQPIIDRTDLTEIDTEDPSDGGSKIIANWNRG